MAKDVAIRLFTTVFVISCTFHQAQNGLAACLFNIVKNVGKSSMELSSVEDVWSLIQNNFMNLQKTIGTGANLEPGDNIAAAAIKLIDFIQREDITCDVFENYTLNATSLEGFGITSHNSPKEINIVEKNGDTKSTTDAKHASEEIEEAQRSSIPKEQKFKQHVKLNSDETGEELNLSGKNKIKEKVRYIPIHTGDSFDTISSEEKSGNDRTRSQKNYRTKPKQNEGYTSKETGDDHNSSERDKETKPKPFGKFTSDETGDDQNGSDRNDRAKPKQQGRSFTVDTGGNENTGNEYEGTKPTKNSKYSSEETEDDHKGSESNEKTKLKPFGKFTADDTGDDKNLSSENERMKPKQQGRSFIDEIGGNQKGPNRNDETKRTQDGDYFSEDTENGQIFSKGNKGAKPIFNGMYTSEEESGDDQNLLQKTKSGQQGRSFLDETGGNKKGWNKNEKAKPTKNSKHTSEESEDGQNGSAEINKRTKPVPWGRSLMNENRGNQDGPNRNDKTKPKQNGKYSFKDTGYDPISPKRYKGAKPTLNGVYSSEETGNKQNNWSSKKAKLRPFGDKEDIELNSSNQNGRTKAKQHGLFTDKTGGNRNSPNRNERMKPKTGAQYSSDETQEERKSFNPFNPERRKFRHDGKYTLNYTEESETRSQRYEKTKFKQHDSYFNNDTGGNLNLLSKSGQTKPKKFNKYGKENEQEQGASSSTEDLNLPANRETGKQRPYKKHDKDEQSTKRTAKPMLQTESDENESSKEYTTRRLIQMGRGLFDGMFSGKIPRKENENEESSSKEEGNEKLPLPDSTDNDSSKENTTKNPNQTGGGMFDGFHGGNMLTNEEETVGSATNGGKEKTLKADSSGKISTRKPTQKGTGIFGVSWSNSSDTVGKEKDVKEATAKGRNEPELKTKSNEITENTNQSGGLWGGFGKTVTTEGPMPAEKLTQIPKAQKNQNNEEPSGEDDSEESWTEAADLGSDETEEAVEIPEKSKQGSLQTGSTKVLTTPATKKSKTSGKQRSTEPSKLKTSSPKSSKLAGKSTAKSKSTTTTKKSKTSKNDGKKNKKSEQKSKSSRKTELKAGSARDDDSEEGRSFPTFFGLLPKKILPPHNPVETNGDQGLIKDHQSLIKDHQTPDLGPVLGTSS